MIVVLFQKKSWQTIIRRAGARFRKVLSCKRPARFSLRICRYQAVSGRHFGLLLRKLSSGRALLSAWRRISKAHSEPYFLVCCAGHQRNSDCIILVSCVFLEAWGIYLTTHDFGDPSLCRNSGPSPCWAPQNRPPTTWR